MIRKLLLVLGGLALAVLGVVGLVLPILPGLVFLVGAAACFSLVSRRFRVNVERRLHRHPRYRRALRRWRISSGLPPLRRARLAFWLTLGSLVPERR